MSQQLKKSKRNGGIYVHVPFCEKKCLYCDFYTGGRRIANWQGYAVSILNELNCRKNEITYKPTTLFIGGGTPSLIPATEFEVMITGIKNITEQQEFEEFTIEVNPEDIEAEKIKTWKSLGVNRVSMGIQSLDDNELKSIGRQHDSRQAFEAFKVLKKEFDNISVDVMFGLPGQTLDSYMQTLYRIIQLQPTHISSYSLMLEEGTALTLLVGQNKVELPSEDEWVEMFELTTSLLKENGYIRYEISNYSLPGWESKHNSSYWKGNPYLGLGPGAHSYDGADVRRANPNDIKGYLKFFEVNPQNNFYKEEKLTQEELREEMIMTRLRMTEGLNLDEFKTRFGKEESNRFLNRVKFYEKIGQLKVKDDNISFTDIGFLKSDDILSRLI